MKYLATHGHRASAGAAIGLMMVVALTLMGCGRKGPPQPPVIQRPARTSDLAVTQVGRAAVLTWSYPQHTTAGGVLPPLESIEVWQARLPLAQEPQLGSPRDRDLIEKLLRSEGEVLLSLADDELVAATEGDQLSVRIPLEPHGEDPQSVLWHAVRTWCCGSRASDFSNIARLEPSETPAPPEELSASPTEEGIVLTWTGRHPVLVERAPTQEGPWMQLTSAPVSGGSWTDATAEQESTWWYRLRSVESPGARLVGLPGSAISVEYDDEYPPRAPEDLVCLPEGGSVRLRWKPSPTAELYRIFRQRGERRWVHLSYHHRTLEFIDRTPPEGSLTYVVKAVDAAGNESEDVRCSTVISPSP